MSVAELDAQPWKLNLQNGTYDLQTFELSEHRREDLLTKLCPTSFDVAADCPLWLSTVELVTCGRKPLQDFLRRLAGYSLRE